MVMDGTFRKTLINGLVGTLHKEYRISEYSFASCCEEYKEEVIAIAESVVNAIELNLLCNKEVYNSEDAFDAACNVVHNAWLLRHKNGDQEQYHVFFDDLPYDQKKKVKTQVSLGHLWFNELSNNNK